jgi:hypothetical protein
MATTYAEGDRIYATEMIGLGLPARSEGAVVKLTGDDAYDLLIEWDAGFLGTVNSGSVALIDKE